MVAKQSAGILLYRRQPELQVLLGRMGGPFWQKKTEHNWSIPKGEYLSDETALAAAHREFTEELGLAVPDIELHDLGSVKQSGDKTVQIFTGEADLDLAHAVFGTFELEWPPKSGRWQSFPELAEVAWTDLSAAQVRLLKGQLPFLARLSQLLQR